jgi:outer membrane protein assembly factor BamB
MRRRLTFSVSAMIVGLALCLVLESRRAPAPAVADAVPLTPMPIASSDFIAFHGGGPLTGVAGPIHAPPMKLRWKIKADDDEAWPTTRPATQPTTQPVYRSPGHFESAVAIYRHTAYAADTSGGVCAIDITTGKRKWVYRSDDGFETTPLVIGGRVLLGDSGGVFHAISVETGKKLWTYDSEAQIHSSANYFGPDRMWVVFGNDGADIVCLDDATGKRIWDQKAGDRVNSSPAVVNGSALVSGCDAELRALREKDGTEEFSAELGVLAPGSAAVSGDLIVVGTDQGRVICISRQTRKQAWLFEGVEEQAMVYSSPAVADNIVVFGARDRNVYGLDLATGKKLWKFTTRGEVDSSPVISAGRVYVGSKDKKLYVLDLKTGKELWSFTAGRGIAATPAIGDGVVIVGDTGGNLFCLE